MIRELQTPAGAYIYDNRFSAFLFKRERKKIISRCDLSNNQNATGFKKAKCSHFVNSFHLFPFCYKMGYAVFGV